MTADSPPQKKKKLVPKLNMYSNPWIGPIGVELLSSLHAYRPWCKEWWRERLDGARSVETGIRLGGVGPGILTGEMGPEV